MIPETGQIFHTIIPDFPPLQHLSVETKSPESFSELMSRLDSSKLDLWTSFVSDKLSEINERTKCIPVSSCSSKQMSSSEDDDADFRDINFPQESALQQVSFSHLVDWPLAMK